MPSISNLVTAVAVANWKAAEIENKIPDTSSLVTNHTFSSKNTEFEN